MKNTIQRLYIAILLFAPLAFGSTEIWAKTILNGTIFLTTLLYFAYIWQHQRSLVAVPGLYFLMGIVGVMLFQVLPLPGFVVKILSPATYELWQDTIGLTTSVGWMRLSVDLKSTVLNIIQYSGYIAFYVLSVQLLSRADFLRRVVHIVVGFAALLSFVAVLQHYSSPDKLLWLRENTGGNGGFGPFVNRNHYAGFMIMMFPLVFCMLIYHKPRVSYATWKEKITEFFDYRGINTYLLMLLSVLMVGISVFVSLSRGGIVSLCFSLILLGIWMASRAKSRQRGRGMMVAALFGVLLISVGWFGWEPVFERFSHIRDDKGDISESRIPAWRDSMDIIGSFPMLGTGSGTFFLSHKAFRNKTPGHGFFVHAHNDYIETAADNGLLGLGLFLGFVVTVFLSYRQYKKRHERFAIYLYMGAITAFGAVLLHSIVEFNLQIGANALYFFFIAALCVAAANTRRHGSSKQTTFLNKSDAPWLKKVSVGAAGFLLICGVAVDGGAYLGELNFNNIMAYFEAPELTPQDYEQVEIRCHKAAIYDPFESHTISMLGSVLALQDKIKEALENYRKAIRRTPLNGEYLQAIADLYDRIGERDAARSLQMSALKHENANPRVHVNYGFWLISDGDFVKGAEAIRQGFSMAPEFSLSFIERLANLYLPYGTLITALPDRFIPYIALGEYLVEADQMDLALDAYARAYKYIANEEEMTPVMFRRLYNFYMDQDMLEDALKVASTAVERLPEDSGLRFTLGWVYEKTGVTYRALEEYERALVLNPRNRSAGRRLTYLKDRI